MGVVSSPGNPGAGASCGTREWLFSQRRSLAGPYRKRDQAAVRARSLQAASPALIGT